MIWNCDSIKLDLLKKKHNDYQSHDMMMLLIDEIEVRQVRLSRLHFRGKAANVSVFIFCAITFSTWLVIHTFVYWFRAISIPHQMISTVRKIDFGSPAPMLRWNRGTSCLPWSSVRLYRVRVIRSRERVMRFRVYSAYAAGHGNRSHSFSQRFNGLGEIFPVGLRWILHGHIVIFIRNVTGDQCGVAEIDVDGCCTACSSGPDVSKLTCRVYTSDHTLLRVVGQSHRGSRNRY